MALGLFLLVLTAAAGFTLYQAIRADNPALGDRLLSRSRRKAGLSEQLSALAQRAGHRFSEPGRKTVAQLQLHSTLSYAGFRGGEAVAVFHLVRVALMTGLAVAGFALSAGAGRSWLAGGAIGCTLGYALPTLTVRHVARSRRRRITSELPDVLSLLVVSLEAGIGLGEVIKLVGREAERQQRVLGQELCTTAAQMTTGRSLEESLKDLGERNGVDELKSVVALAIQSERVGARMAPALRASSDLLNSRRRLAAEEAANKAAVKMLIPLVFLILPAMMLIVLGPAIIQILHMFSQTR